MVVHAPLKDLHYLPPVRRGDGQLAVGVRGVSGNKKHVFSGRGLRAREGNGGTHVRHCGTARVVIPQRGLNAVVDARADARAAVENWAPLAIGFGYQGQGRDECGQMREVNVKLSYVSHPAARDVALDL